MNDIQLDFVFGATFPCSFCKELTAHGVTRRVADQGDEWVSVCKKCAKSATDDIDGAFHFFRRLEVEGSRDSR